MGVGIGGDGSQSQKDPENSHSTNVNAYKEKKLIDSIWVGFIGNYYTTYYNQLVQKMEEE